MKFLTKELINRLDVLIQERETAEAAHNAKEEAKVAETREQWLEKYGDSYVLFANRIKDKIRKGRPIAQGDVPDDLSDGYGRFRGFYSEYQPRLNSETASDLRTLRTALQAVTDEEVTTTGLRQIGFTDIARLFRGTK